MAGRHRSIEHKSCKPVQKFNGRFELLAPLPQTAMDILGVLGAEGVAGEAARIAGVVKSDVTYWKNRFVQAGALIPRTSQTPVTLGKSLKEQRIAPGTPKYYDLTPYGSKLLTGSDSALRLPVVLEDFPVKFVVLRWERVGCIDWRKLGQPRNWNKFGFRVTGVHVVKTSRSVIIHPGPLKGFNVDVLEVDSGRIVERVRYILEVKFGMQLADDCMPVRKVPRWQVYRPECRDWAEAGTCEVESVGGLDVSPKPSKSGVRNPLSRVPHLEYNDKRHAAVAAAFPVASDPLKRRTMAAVNFPVVLENIESKIDFLTESVCRLVDLVGKLSDTLGKLFNLEGPAEGNTVSGKGVPDYVS